jgi:hypothetical protein
LSNNEYRNKTITVPIIVQGRKDGPYVLMSLPSDEPNLHAVDVVDAYNATKIFCLHFDQADHKATTNIVDKKIQMKNQSMFESSLAMFENDFNAFI